MVNDETKMEQIAYSNTTPTYEKKAMPMVK